MRRFSGLLAVMQEARADNVTGEAAKVAYYFFLSLWPLLLGLFAFTGIFGGEPAFDWIMGWIRSVLPGTQPASSRRTSGESRWRNGLTCSRWEFS